MMVELLPVYIHMDLSGEGEDNWGGGWHKSSSLASEREF